MFECIPCAHECLNVFFMHMNVWMYSLCTWMFECILCAHNYDISQVLEELYNILTGESDKGLRAIEKSNR